MGFTFGVGKTILCLALFFQGIFLTGVIPNKGILSSMQKGVAQFQNGTGIHHPVFKVIEQQIENVAIAIGALLCLAIFNIVSNSRFIIKMNMLGITLLTIFIGIPWRVFQRKTNPIDTTDKALNHFYINLAILGGLIYYHSVTSIHVTKTNKHQEE